MVSAELAKQVMITRPGGEQDASCSEDSRHSHELSSVRGRVSAGQSMMTGSLFGKHINISIAPGKMQLAGINESKVAMALSPFSTTEIRTKIMGLPGKATERDTRVSGTDGIIDDRNGTSTVTDEGLSVRLFGRKHTREVDAEPFGRGGRLREGPRDSTPHGRNTLAAGIILANSGTSASNVLEGAVKARAINKGG